MIKFENVTKAYPDGTVAVDGLNLEAPTGKLTILVGPFRLRQDHLPEDDQPPHRTHQRHHLPG